MPPRWGYNITAVQTATKIPALRACPNTGQRACTYIVSAGLIVRMNSIGKKPYLGEYKQRFIEIAV